MYLGSVIVGELLMSNQVGSVSVRSNHHQHAILNNPSLVEEEEECHPSLRPSPTCFHPPSLDYTTPDKGRPGDPGNALVPNTLTEWVLKRSKGAAVTPTPKVLGVRDVF
eukprot:gene11248-15053_t